MSKETCDTIAARAASGESAGKIARGLRVPASTVEDVLQRKAVPPPQDGMVDKDGHVTPEGRARILQLADQNKPVSQITKELGVQRSAVRSVIDQDAIPAPKPGMMEDGRVTELGRDRIRQLAGGRRTLQKIAEEVGVGRSKVYAILQENDQADGQTR